ncbi:hypothetical protein [Pseudobacteriovorax antillogorgiicola]|uniref:Uncharacterized protein n=1 Tax=Pseudobacteriovorax antillogorgiicola TaxID=1513793 RepID=A0A1Y6BEH5_9BACT|nr:hypothetical protein [Pseudobacteriovorax antillogorgiicola]TCS56405.1 hypothetical protein EDD56_104227 [Pseudobacteriovorax antillogorgiicola]SMF05981.1 hypothetical protein SAMN06296036_104106 [Pseudobacteriovorax antillogorgiicola]
MARALRNTTICFLISFTYIACSDSSFNETESDKSSETKQSTDSTVEDELFTINEPISVGGAFLTCTYQPDQAQEQVNKTAECQLAGIEESKVETFEAKFFKLDIEGASYPLEILENDGRSLRWIVQETPATLQFPSFQLRLSINGSEEFNFEAKAPESLELAVNLAYWLAGEPNDFETPGVPGNEDCVEMRAKPLRDAHIASSGIDNGPLAALNDVPCVNFLNSPFLCRKVNAATQGPLFLISDFTGEFNSYASACPDSYFFGLPHGEDETLQVINLLDNQEGVDRIWVNLNDQVEENSFQVIMNQSAEQ